MLDQAQQRAAKTLTDQTTLADEGRRWLLMREDILDGPFEDVVAVLIDPSERGYELRQNTPFVGILSDEDRVDAVRQASRELPGDSTSLRTKPDDSGCNETTRWIHVEVVPGRARHAP